MGWQFADHSWITYQTTIPDRYHKVRQLSSETNRLWQEALLRHVPAGEIESIVDLGSGTGRFSGLLAETFQAEVVGVEPSGKVRAQAEPAGAPGTGRSQFLTLQGEIISSGPKQ